jgi:hypothetical protein
MRKQKQRKGQLTRTPWRTCSRLGYSVAVWGKAAEAGSETIGSGAAEATAAADCFDVLLEELPPLRLAGDRTPAAAAGAADVEAAAGAADSRTAAAGATPVLTGELDFGNVTDCKILAVAMLGGGEVWVRGGESAVARGGE